LCRGARPAHRLGAAFLPGLLAARAQRAPAAADRARRIAVDGGAVLGSRRAGHASRSNGMNGPTTGNGTSPVAVTRRLRGDLEHDPEKACPGLDPGGYRFSEKHALGLGPRDHAPTIK